LKQTRKRLTYANVMSSLAVFLVLGGATAFAAGHLGKNTVGTKQLKKNAVTGAKVKNHSLKAADFKAGQLPTGPQGPKGDQGPRGEQGPKGDTGPAGIPATRLWASVDATGTLTVLHGEGVTGVEPGGLTGLVNVTFDRDVSECSFQVTPLGHGGGYLTPTVTAAITTGFYSGSGLGYDQVRVTTYYEDAPAERDFDIAAFC
jgi:hypothetical protein